MGNMLHEKLKKLSQEKKKGYLLRYINLAEDIRDKVRSDENLYSQFSGKDIVRSLYDSIFHAAVLICTDERGNCSLTEEEIGELRPELTR